MDYRLNLWKEIIRISLHSSFVFKGFTLGYLVQGGEEGSMEAKKTWKCEFFYNKWKKHKWKQKKIYLKGTVMQIIW